jgi:hypothetical protein
LGFQNHIDGNMGILGGDARMPVLDPENTSGEAREKKEERIYIYRKKESIVHSSRSFCSWNRLHDYSVFTK